MALGIINREQTPSQVKADARHLSYTVKPRTISGPFEWSQGPVLNGAASAEMRSLSVYAGQHVVVALLDRSLAERSAKKCQLS